VIPGKGAGRPAGRSGNMSRALVQQAALEGELPHQFLLRVMRGQDEFFVEETLTEDGPVYHMRRPYLSERIDAAKAAAPYYAPRLAEMKVQASGAVGIADLKEMLDINMRECAAKEILKELNYQFDE